MGKLIEADALLASLRESRDRANVWMSDCREYGSEMTGRAEQAVMTFNECILRVKGAPTVDAVPVIRCKDCKHYDFTDNRIPEEQVWWCYFWDDVRSPDAYCSDGERKKDGEHETD